MCKPVCSSGSDSDVTECNNSDLEYKLYQSVLKTFGRDPAYQYMPDIETEDAYSGTKGETDVDDYKITGLRCMKWVRQDLMQMNRHHSN